MSEPLIYRHATQSRVDLPNLDLLTLLFDSEHSVALPESIVHAEADNPSNKLDKAGLEKLTQQIAHGLRHRYQLGANGLNKDIVTVISYGDFLLPAVFFGIIAAGGVYSAASPSSTVSDLARQVDITSSRVIICGPDHLDVAAKAATKCGVPLSRVLVLNSSTAGWSLASLEGNIQAISDNQTLAWQRMTDPQALKDSLIVILWSSGTTGLPKGVMLSHRNLVAETYLGSLLGRQWAAKQLEEAGNNFTPSEYRTIAHLPTSHIAGLFGYFIVAMYNGGTVYWMRRYEWRRLLEHVKKFRITSFYTVPSIYLRIAKSADVTDQFATVEGATTGAAPMDAALQNAASARLGGWIGQTWGLSETTGAVTAIPKGEVDYTGCIGYILPGVELRLVDDAYRDVTEPEAPGELLVRAPMVTNGYYNNPQATREAFRGDWFCTGDIAVRRDGKFFIVDRKKELLKYKGLQVAPAEIENVLFSHPDILEAAVVGIPAPADPGTDWPRAYVVKAPGSRLTEKGVETFVQERLANYKWLRGGVCFVNEIPKNAIGKFLRRELRGRAKEEVQGSKAKL